VGFGPTGGLIASTSAALPSDEQTDAFSQHLAANVGCSRPLGLAPVLFASVRLSRWPACLALSPFGPGPGAGLWMDQPSHSFWRECRIESFQRLAALRLRQLG